MSGEKARATREIPAAALSLGISAAGSASLGVSSDCPASSGIFAARPTSSDRTVCSDAKDEAWFSTLEAGSILDVRLHDAASDAFLLTEGVSLRVERPLAAGGTAAAYAARAVGAQGVLPEGFSEKTVVVKAVASPDLAANEWAHLKEFRSMSVLPEPYFFGAAMLTGGGTQPSCRDGARPCRTDAQPCRVLVMEFVEGERLSAWARAWEEKRGYPPPFEAAMAALNPVIDFLAVISASRPPLVHRDIKPDNIIVQESGGSPRGRLIDLGIAERSGSSSGIGRWMGTYGFAAPEVLEGEDAEAAGDARVDTFGLAATVYCALSGSVYDYAWRGRFPIAHDDALRESVRAASSAYVFEHFGIEPDEAVLEGAVSQAFSDMDDETLAALRLGLSADQGKRPHPAEFADMLPRRRVRASLERQAVVRYLERAAQGAGGFVRVEGALRFVEADVDVQASTLSDRVRYAAFARDMVRAMDAWNCGRYGEAAPLLRRLAEAGDATSQYNLGICIRDGLGGLSGEAEEVLWWWTEAARGGHIVAMYNIGRCLEMGYGVPADAAGVDAAAPWYRRAATEGFPLAIERLRELGISLSGES